MSRWVDWHDAYADPHSSLSRRVDVVCRRIREVVGLAPAAPTLLSLCAGDGRDVIEVCRDAGGPPIGRAVLVEADRELARRAERDAAGVDVVEVRCADASDPASFGDVLPADVVLMCGILGNVAPTTVPDIVRRASLLVDAGGFVIWTRGGGEPDRRPEVRAAFVQSGFEELAFDGAPEPFGVGVSRLRSRPSSPPPTAPLFEFIR